MNPGAAELLILLLVILILFGSAELPKLAHSMADLDHTPDRGSS